MTMDNMVVAKSCMKTLRIPLPKKRLFGLSIEGDFRIETCMYVNSKTVDMDQRKLIQPLDIGRRHA